MKEALDRGAELFNWDERKARAGKRQGSKVRGVGVAVGPHGAGSIGYDGLMTIRPDGKLYVQSGVGNLGTHSVHRPRARRRRRAGDAVGQGRRQLGQHREEPAVVVHVGRQPDDARDDAGESGGRRRRAAEAAGDRRAAISAARRHDYALGDERVYRRDNPSRGLTYAQAAERAIALGGKYDGHELPADIHAMTKAVGRRRSPASG